ncbi:unnamed protein product [Linum tenue]|uniref:Uncharacterized protein n=1 Tax=Linum tenue TaxID=586396 RepID=A0AAV0H6Q8_9ROSI|nr:unnamed protein product [Linum tenue]
MMSASRLYGL